MPCLLNPVSRREAEPRTPAPGPAAPPPASGNDFHSQHRLRCHARDSGTAVKAEPVMPSRQLQNRSSTLEHTSRPRRSANVDTLDGALRDRSLFKTAEHPPYPRRPRLRFLRFRATQIDRGDRKIGIAHMKKAELEPGFVAGSKTQHRRHREFE